MRTKKNVENRTLKGAAAEFIAIKRAQKTVSEHDMTTRDINPFAEQSFHSGCLGYKSPVQYKTKLGF